MRHLAFDLDDKIAGGFDTPNRRGAGYGIPHYTLSAVLVKDIIKRRKSLPVKELGQRGRGLPSRKSFTTNELRQFFECK